MSVGGFLSFSYFPPEAEVLEAKTLRKRFIEDEAEDLVMMKINL